MMLSPHFSLAEMTVSQTAARRGIKNEPDAAQTENLRRLAQLLERCDLTEHDELDQRPLTIGVIAPYRAQINYLKDAIEDSAVLNDLLLQRRLSVGTVDSFQGQERDIIAITLTRSNPQGEIGFLSDIRRMNVGMTRARRKLLLVGDSSTLCSHPFFVELLAYVKGVGGYRTAQTAVL